MVVGLLSSFFGQVKAFTASPRGWGDQFRWLPLDQGLQEASRYNKPLMIVVHKMTCPACRHLKRRFVQPSPIHQLTNNFVMVNLEPDEVPEESSFAPDGNYVPRVLFFTPSGYLMRDVKNKYRSEYQFTYSDPAFLQDAMRQALENVNVK